MGNCISKKSHLHPKQHRYSSSIERSTKVLPPYLLASSTPLNTSSEQQSLYLSHLSEKNETNIILNDNDENEKKVIQYSSSTILTSRTSSPNDEHLFIHQTSISSPIQLSSECKKFKSSNAVIVLSENHIKQPFTLITNEQDTSMGHLFNKENDINKENEKTNSNTSSTNGNEKTNVDIKVYRTDKDQSNNQQYFTLINEKNLSNRDIMVNTRDIIQDSLDTSPSSSLFDSSLSSLSCNTTPFSSQDRLILSSSSSSSSSTVLSPLPSTTHISSAPSSNLSNGSRSLNYSEQIYLNHQLSYLFSSNETFPIVLPMNSSRSSNDFFLNEFHQNLRSYNCKTLRTVIDNVTQQQFIRIHQSSNVILIEHKELQCVQIKDVKKFHTPSLIYDDQQNLIHITKHARSLGLQSFTSRTNQISRLPKLFSSCDHCSSLLSASKLHHRLQPFILVNTTHHLVQMCFNQIHDKNIFGYISQKHPQKIRQIRINNSKLSYSYDLDITHTSFYFVIRVQTWPQDVRQIYEQRQRLWPMNIENLFDETCFIRIETSQEDKLTLSSKCSNCEQYLSSSIDSCWSYTYTAIESKLIEMMSDDQKRFASIVWNYLNGKTQGQLPFNVFKHTLFYFLEKYSSDSFISCDLLSQIHFYTDYLYYCLQNKSIPHYFNSKYNFYHEHHSLTLINLLTIKITYFDLKHFHIYHLSKSSFYLYYFIYLIEFEKVFHQVLLSSKTHSIQTILDTHEFIIKQLLIGIQIYKRQLDTNRTIQNQRTLTLDCLYHYQEHNVQIIVDYLPLLREKEPSLILHSLWSMFIQYFNCFFDDLFIC